MSQQGLDATRPSTEHRALTEHRRHELELLERLVSEQHRPIPRPPSRGYAVGRGGKAA